MGSSAVPTFDKSAQTTHLWLNEIGEEIGLDDQQSWHVTGAVLHALRDRLPIELAAHLGSQLPLLVRGAYYDQFRPSELPKRVRSLDEFLQMIAAELTFGRPVNTKDAARAVFKVLSRHLSPGQVDKVREALPEEVRTIWSEPGTQDSSGRVTADTSGRSKRTSH
ncbi:DUF2267 domain-containing protein [Bradyrhizobium sp. 197]|jgi:uncharacterized protein (DUF2267 family)|uniref:DUF2267 domain-containing protein n=1 Tax=Bradyrhizobium sp. 197 TaxID=2782663 RepID=UPI001FFB2261|nr:DUF2267 domain-containing protein [Bradyrhizobium sp. 197]MCK1479122.1 DUF2267 domain-containing protein [Bradyrhizobium sp. 197]